LIFGLTAFLYPIIGLAGLHGIIPEKLIGTPSYFAFNALFEWGDDRWDKGLRDRNFSFAPTYISAEAMKWWLSKDGFAQHGCILAPEREWRREEEEDALEDYLKKAPGSKLTDNEAQVLLEKHEKEPYIPMKWYDNQTPPFAFWVAGQDSLVDGRKLLNRFHRGREPDVRVVHAKLIEEYQHLDVIWSCDVIKKVGVELRDVIWKTCNMAREQARVPIGCETLQPWYDDRSAEKQVVQGEEIWQTPRESWLVT
jgi:hypothetical protein